MAEEETEKEQKSGGGKKRLLLMVVLGLLIVALSVGGTLFALKVLMPQETTSTAETDEDVVDEEPLPMPAIYFPIKPAIIVNFQVKGRQRFLQAEITLMMREDDVVSAIELHQPMLRNALVILIGGQSYAEIQTAEGKELLRQMCLKELRELIEAEIGKPGIEEVLFTNLVMQ